jgi:hypothetical protein
VKFSPSNTYPGYTCLAIEDFGEFGDTVVYMSPDQVKQLRTRLTEFLKEIGAE